MVLMQIPSAELPDIMAAFGKEAVEILISLGKIEVV